MDERVMQAGWLYEQAVFTGEDGLLAEADQQLDAAEADLAVARGKILHSRFLLSRDLNQAQAREDPRELALFERAARLFRALSDVRGEAEALFWCGCFHQIIRRDNATAVPLLEQSLDLASQASDKPVMAEALRHLGIAALAGDDRMRPGSGWRTQRGCAARPGSCPAWPRTLLGWPT